MNFDFFSRFQWWLSAVLQEHHNRRRMKRAMVRPKVFCIGLNKTGTTSWAQAMSDLGYILGSETKATMYYYHWARGDFRQIIKYCESGGEAFQDIPFSLPNTYISIDQAFPGCKFILTVRDTPEQWYDSLTTFHSKCFSKSKNIPPTSHDIESAIYWKSGFIADFCEQVFKTPKNDPYNRAALLNFYCKYNDSIIEYFSGRANDFLVVNVAKQGCYEEMCSFLGHKGVPGGFPWKNKT